MNYIKKYDKASNSIFAKLSDKIGLARSRASSMNKSTLDSASRDNTKPYHLNPFTDFYTLLDSIDEFMEKGDLS